MKLFKYLFLIGLLGIFSAANAQEIRQKSTENSSQTNIILPEMTANTDKQNETAKKTDDKEKLTDREKSLLERIENLEKKLAEVENRLEVLPKNETKNETVSANEIVATETANNKPSQTITLTEEDRGVLDFFKDITINFGVDGYFTQNFNRPYNRFNLLRAFDTSSSSFSLGQANVVIENAPNVEKGKRFGFRLDLQYGQATQTVQGNSANELRPEIYRPLWQAYGTYVAPIGKGLTLDFGKFAGSLGYETNYTKDNFNYSRSYFFNYLPYYHFGVRAAYPITDKLTATYWLVNGAQQSEDFNNSKSQAVLLTYKPTEKIILQGNYYFGEEQRDQEIADENTPANFDVSRGRITPKGKFHVFDAYGTFLLSDKTTFAIEGDYVVNRFNRRDAPSVITGGAVYLRHQFTPKFALAGRGEYLSDKNGLFSGTSQALKETTLTAEYKFAEGFMLRGEFRRDWSNRPYFLTNDFNVLKKEQNTATLGFIWWFGRKQGAW